MAAPPCQSGDGNTAVFIGTWLTSGDTVAVCQECFAPWAAAGLEAFTGVDTSVVFEIERQQAEAAATTAEGAPTDEPPAAAPADSDELVTDGEGGLEHVPAKARKPAKSAATAAS